MKVYRIANREGRGPYTGQMAWEQWATENHNCGPVHPAPQWDLQNWSEVPARTRNKCVFGFRTLKQLRKWFNATERKRLSRMGYVIVRVEVAALVAESALQCAFLPTNNYIQTVAK